MGGLALAVAGGLAWLWVGDEVYRLGRPGAEVYYCGSDGNPTICAEWHARMDFLSLISVLLLAGMAGGALLTFAGVIARGERNWTGHSDA